MFWLFTNFNFLEYDHPTLIFLFEATTQRGTKGGRRRGVSHGEGAGTSNFRTSTGQKFQNVEMVFLVDQNVESDLPMAFCLLNLT